MDSNLRIRAPFRNPFQTTIAKDALSDVVRLPDGRFVVNPDSGNTLQVLTPRERASDKPKVQTFKLPDLPHVEGRKNKNDIEGLTFGQLDGQNVLFVACEEPAHVLAFALDLEAKDFNPRKLADIPLPDELRTEPNSGIEALSFISADQSPTGSPLLLAAKEKLPPEILVMDPRTLAITHRIAVPESGVGVPLQDLAGMSFDDRGRLLIQSQETGRAVAFRLTADAGELALQPMGEVHYDGRSEASLREANIEGVQALPGSTTAMVAEERSGRLRTLGYQVGDEFTESTPLHAVPYSPPLK